MPADGLGDVGGLVAHGVGKLLGRDPVAAHDGHGRVAAFVGVPVADADPAGDLAEPPVERVSRVLGTAFVAEHQTGVGEKRNSSGTRDSAEVGLAAVFLEVERNRASPVPGRGIRFALGDGIDMP